MSKLMVIKRNALYERGMYGYSVHESETGGAGNVVPAKSKADLRRVLVEFGLTTEYADDVLDRLDEKHESVKIDLEKKTISGFTPTEAKRSNGSV